MAKSDFKIDKRHVVTDDEDLFRLISYPGCISDDGELSPDIFSLYHKDETYVSHDRAYYISEEEAMRRGPFILNSATLY